MKHLPNKQEQGVRVEGTRGTMWVSSQGLQGAARDLYCHLSFSLAAPEYITENLRRVSPFSSVGVESY